LLLTDREEVVAFGHNRIQFELHFVDVVVKVDFFQDIPDLFISAFTEWIDVFSDLALQQERSLRDKGNLLSENVKASFSNVYVVNQNLTFFELTKTEEGLKDGGLASSSSTNDSDFHFRLNCEAQILNRRFKSFPVSHSSVFELNFTLAWPNVSFLLFENGLVRGLRKFVLHLKLRVHKNALSRSKEVFNLAVHAHTEAEEGYYVSQNLQVESQNLIADLPLGEDGKQACATAESHANQVKIHPHPAVDGEVGEGNIDALFKLVDEHSFEVVDSLVSSKT
jgi:hypothetical protein